MTLDTINRNPSQTEVLELAIDTKLKSINVCLPAVVQKFDFENKLVEVQPALKIKLKDKDPMNLPLIQDVPVVYPRSETAGVYFPLKEGDSCLLVCSQRSIDNWLTNGGVVDPANPRKFSLSDATAIVGLYPTSKQLPINDADKDNLVLVNEKGSLAINPSGSIVLSGSNSQGDEPFVLGNVLATFLTDIIEILKTTPTSISSAPGSPAGINPALISSLEAKAVEFIDNPQTNILSQKIFGER